MKKVFICITKSNWGGAQKYVFDLASGLPKDTFDITVLLGGNGELKKRLEEAGIKTITLQNSQRDIDTKKEFGLLIELYTIFKKEKPDIIHLNSSKMGLGTFAGRMAGIRKIIFTVHGFAFSGNRSFVQKIIIKILSWLTIIFSTQTIFVSKNDKDTAKNWPFCAKKMNVIHNGIGNSNLLHKEAAMQKLSDAIHRPKDIFINKKIIGTIAEISFRKGIEVAVDAISKMENVLYFAIGNGDELQKLRDKIIAQKSHEKIFLTGAVKNASDLMVAFDYFLLPARQEGLPYVLLEAGAASLPTIATNINGIPEVIENNVTGILIKPGDANEIKRSIQNLIDHPETAIMLGKNLNEKIAKEFRLERMVRETIQIYSK